MTKKIKILHIIGRYPKGGVGSFLSNIQANIDKSTIRFDYLVNDSKIKSNFENEVRKYGSELIVLPQLSLRHFQRYLRALDNFYCKHNDYDAIHIHSVNITIFNYYYAKKYGIRNILAHSHSTKSSDTFWKRTRNFLLITPVKKLATHLLACNKESAEFLYGKNSVLKNEVFIIKNAINTRLFAFNIEDREYIRNKYGWTNKFIIGHVGNFIPVKNHTFLLRVFKEMIKRKPNSLLLLIGDGETKEFIEQMTEKLNIEDSVVFVGASNKVYQYMQAFDVFVLPSKFEGLPLVGVEAQTSGLPCFFSSNISREIEITENVSFLNIDSSPSKWADFIVETTENFVRQDLSKQVTDAGYDIASEAKKLERFYCHLAIEVGK